MARLLWFQQICLDFSDSKESKPVVTPGESSESPRAAGPVGATPLSVKLPDTFGVCDTVGPIEVEFSGA